MNDKLLHDMLLRLQYFKNEKIGIRRLIDDLESLFNLLEDDINDSNWSDDFLSTWGVLEDEYSSLVCSDKTRFDDEQWDSIVKAVLELENLIQKKIKSLG